MANYCNKCGRPSKPNARFCPHCGARLQEGTGQVHSHKNKRDKVLRKNGRGMPGYMMVIFGGAIVAVLSVLAYSVLSTPGNSAIESQPVVSSDINYSDSGLQMVDIGAKTSNGKIIVLVDVIKKNRFVAFQYTNNSETVPLLAYVAPNGKLVTAVSMCEPCRSTRFHISGSNIICNTCGTTWDIQTLQSVSGACGAYPPQVIPSKIVGNTVQIDVKTLANWQPRA